MGREPRIIPSAFEERLAQLARPVAALGGSEQIPPEPIPYYRHLTGTTGKVDQEVQPAMSLITVENMHFTSEGGTGLWTFLLRFAGVEKWRTQLIRGGQSPSFGFDPPLYHLTGETVTLDTIATIGGGVRWHAMIKGSIFNV